VVRATATDAAERVTAVAVGTAILCLLIVTAGVLIIVRETRESNRRIERKLADDLALRVSVDPGLTVATTVSQRCGACRALNRLRSPAGGKGARCGRCGLPLPAVRASVRG
jgi:hypothetical protein